MTITSSPEQLSEDTPARGVPAVNSAPVTPAVPSPIASEVAVVIVTHGLTPYLPALIESVLSQSVLPHRIVVMDVSTQAPLTLPEHLAARSAIPIEVAGAPRAKNFGQGVGMALKLFAELASTQWLWLLHDDSVVHTDVLEFLLLEVKNSASISIAGTKQVRYGSPKDLINVGFSVAAGGQRLSGVELTEFDQGQHDAREDVFAVSLNGAIVRTDVWRELKGTDPTYGRYGDSLDFCRRARLAGHRVVVVPQAVVEHAQASYTGVRDAERIIVAPKPLVIDEEQDTRTYFARLKSALYYSATSYVPVVVPLVWLVSVLCAPVRSLYRIAFKQPRQAIAELLTPLWLFTKMGNALGATIKMSLIKKVPRAALRELMVPLREVWSYRRDLRLARSTLRQELYGPSDLDRHEMAQVKRRRRVTLAAMFVGLVTLSLVAFFDLLGGLSQTNRIIGGSLLPAQANLADLWQTWTGGWVRDGLGAAAPADPLILTLMPLAGLTGGSAQLAVNLVVLLAIVMSGLGAWFAAGAVTRALSIRAWATFLWVAAPSLLLAVGQGRLGAIVAHCALPWLVLTLLRAFGVHQVDQRSRLRLRQQQEADAKLEQTLEAARLAAAQAAAIPVAGSASAAPSPVSQTATQTASGPVSTGMPEGLFGSSTGSTDQETRPRSLAALGGAALLFAVVVAGAPILFLPGLGVLVILAFFVPRSRLLWIVPIPAAAVLGPLLYRSYVNRGHEGWRILFGDPGVPLAYDVAPAWQNLLSLPINYQGLNMGGGIWAGALSLLPFAIGGIVLVGALLSLLRTGPAAKPIRMLWLIAAIGFATAVLSSNVIVASGPSGAVTSWAGTGISLGFLALLGACVLGATGITARAMAFNFGWRQILLGLATLLIFAVPLGGLASWSVNRTFAGQDSALHVLEKGVVPAVAQQMQNSGRQARVLALSPDGVDAVDYQFFHRDGAQMLEASAVVDVSHLGGRPDDIADLVAHLSRGLEAEDTQPAVYQLGAMGVGSVLVPASTSQESANLVARLDNIEGLQRVTENSTGTLWRVQPLALEPDLAELEETVDQGPDAVTNAVVIPQEPAWAVLYDSEDHKVLSNGEPLEATRLSVNTVLEPSDTSQLILIAENAAPGWTARLGGVSLPRVTINGMQGFDLSGFTGTGGTLSISYERAAQIPWLILQGTVLTVYLLLAIPLRRRGMR